MSEAKVLVAEEAEDATTAGDGVGIVRDERGEVDDVGGVKENDVELEAGVPKPAKPANLEVVCRS
jgi:hypothetical protein